MRMQQLVERLGEHPIRVLGIDLESNAGPDRWLIAACLLSGRADEATSKRAYQALEGDGLTLPRDIAAADPMRVALRLADADYPKPEIAAQRILRASAAVGERFGGSLARLASDALDLDELGARLTSLAPGFGPTAALQFLRPLRDLWVAARETPLTRAARVAAEHLGWLASGEDSEGEPGALRAALAREPAPPALVDVEAALDRLGRRACVRNRPDRCPLRNDCPVRIAGVAAAALRE